MARPGRLVTLSFLLTALTVGASAVWRGTYPDMTANRSVPWREAFGSLATDLGIDILGLLGALAVLFVGSRGGRLTRAAVAFAIGTGYVYVCATRLLDHAYYYYGGLHLDLLFLHHAQGEALDLRPGPELYGPIAVTVITAIGGVVLIVSLMRTVAECSGAVVGRGVAGAALGLGVAAGALLVTAPPGPTPLNPGARIEHFPEARLLQLWIAPPADVDDALTTRLDPELVRKLTRFGLTIDPTAAEPFRRERAFDRPLVAPRSANRPNVIVLLFESFSAALCSAYDGCEFPGLTPNLERFARESMTVHGFYNAATPTWAGTSCTLASSIPPYLLGDALQDVDLDHLDYLPHILGRNGYDTVFLHQVSDDYLDVGREKTRMGFQRVLGRDAVGRLLREPPLARWGYSDAQMFRALRRTLATDVGEPFLLVMPTLDSHAPFRAEPDAPAYGDGNSTLLNTIHATDRSFGRFWDAFRKSPRHADTIIVALADHAMFPGSEYRELRTGEDIYQRLFDETMLIVHDPTRDRRGPQRILSSQVDVAPTILHLLGIEQANHFEGRSLFGDRSERRGVLGMTPNEFFVLEEVDGKVHREQFLVQSLRATCAGGDSEPGRLTGCDLYAYFRWKRTVHRAARLGTRRLATQRPKRDPRRDRAARSLAEWLQQLVAEDPPDRIDAITALASQPDWATAVVPALRALLGDASGDIRAHAAEGLGRLGIAAVAARDDLLARLDDENPYARAAACTALARIAPDSAPVRAGLRARLSDPHREVRVAVALALAQTSRGAPAAADALQQALRDADTLSRIALLEALSQVGGANAEALCAELRNPHPGVQLAAALALAEHGATATACLRPLLRDPSPATRAAAAHALGKLGSDARSAIDDLIALLGDPQATLRCHAIWNLGAIAPADPRVRNGLVLRLSDAEATVRNAAVETLGLSRTAAAPAVPAMVALLDDPATRHKTIDALGRVGEAAASAGPAIARLLPDADPALRLAALRALGRIGSADAPIVANVTAQLTDRDPAIQLAAVDALGGIAPQDRAAIEQLEQLAKDAPDALRARIDVALRAIRR